MKKYCKDEIVKVENIPGIYIIRNTINGKCYIGQSIYLKKRLLKHITLADRKMYNTPLYNSIQKYGIDSFEFDILETLNTNNFKEAKTQLDIWEKDYIMKYNSYGDTGYNQTFGGDVGIIGYKFTEEQKKHQSEVRQEHESEKLDMLYVYVINGPKECKYITACNLIGLNRILRYHNWKEIDPKYLRDAKKNGSTYGMYIIASSKKDLENKISDFNRSNRNFGKFKKVNQEILDQYKLVVDSLSSKTVKEIMTATGLDRHTIYNRNIQVYGTRVLTRMRK